MKVLMINGSSHEDGCMYTALREVEKTLRQHDIDAEILWIGDQPIRGCAICGQCFALGKCVIDDAVNTVAAAADNIDGLVIGAPYCFDHVSSQVTSLLVRLLYSASYKFAAKPAAVIVSGSGDVPLDAFRELNGYFRMNNIQVVSSRSCCQIHGNTAEEAEQDVEGLQAMRTLGEDMALFLENKK